MTARNSNFLNSNQSVLYVKCMFVEIQDKQIEHKSRNYNEWSNRKYRYEKQDRKWVVHFSSDYNFMA